MTTKEKETWLSLERMTGLNKAQRELLQMLRYKRMKERVSQALEDYSASQLLDMLIEVTDQPDLRDLAGDMIEAANGITTGHCGKFITVKVDTMDQETKLMDFVENELYPLYNDQQTCIF